MEENSGKREEVPLERIVLSNMYSLEALIDVQAEPETVYGVCEGAIQPEALT